MKKLILFFKKLFLNTFGKKFYYVDKIPWYIKILLGKPKYKKDMVLQDDVYSYRVIVSDKIFIGLNSEDCLTYLYIVDDPFDDDLKGFLILENNLF